MMTRIRSKFSLFVMCVSGAGLVALAGCAQDVKDIRTEGIDQYRNRQYVESMATLRYGLSIKPSDAESNYFMGLNYRALAAEKFRDGDIPAAERDLDTAIMYFSQAIKSWPNYQAAVDGKTEAYESRGKYLKALDVADSVAYNNRGGAAEHYIYAGDKYRDSGDYDSALQRYKLALATDPNNPRAYASMGRMFEMAGDNVKAMDAYQRAHELDPHNTAVNEALAALSGMPESSEPGTVTENPNEQQQVEPPMQPQDDQQPEPPPAEPEEQEQ